MATPKQKAFLSIPECAALLGEHRVTVYHRAKQHGHINGVRVVMKSPNQMVIPRRQFEAALGIGPEPTYADVPVDWFETR